MSPNLPVLDYSLVMQWSAAILGQFWPVVAVILGVVVGVTIFKLYRKAVSD